MKKTTFEKLYKDALKEAGTQKIAGYDAEIVLIPVAVTRSTNPEAAPFGMLQHVSLQKINDYEMED